MSISSFNHSFSKFWFLNVVLLVNEKRFCNTIVSCILVDFVDEIRDRCKSVTTTIIPYHYFLSRAYNNINIWTETRNRGNANQFPAMLMCVYNIGLCVFKIFFFMLSCLTKIKEIHRFSIVLNVYPHLLFCVRCRAQPCFYWSWVWI